MDAKLRPVARADALDRERFADMIASEAFARIELRIAAELERQRVECEQGTDVRRSQGAVAALRMVLSLPAQMLGEMKKP